MTVLDKLRREAGIDQLKQLVAVEQWLANELRDVKRAIQKLRDDQLALEAAGAREASIYVGLQRQD